jgi:hypothetical protein
MKSTVQCQCTPWHKWMAAFAVAAMLLFTALPVQAAPIAQDDQPVAIMLGEMARRELANGESALYSVTAPADGLYVITTADEQEAGKFDLIVTNTDGEEVFDDVFGTVELELSEGDYTLELTAVEDGVLSLFVTGQLGDMTDDFSDPGEMINGGFFVTENVEGSLYAKLTIGESPYWQRAFVVVQGGDGDSYSASVSGEDIYETLSDSSASTLLPFWTRGGEYDLEVSPLSGGANLTVMTLLSGPTPQLASGEGLEGELSGDNLERFYQFEVTQPGALVNVSLTSDADDADMDLSVGLDPASSTWSSASLESNEVVDFMAPVAGTYFVRVYSHSGEGAFSISAEEGDLAPELPIGELTWDTVTAESVRVYRMEAPESGQILTVILVGSPGQDLDLSVSLSNEAGENVHSLSSSGLDSVEMVAQSDAQAGLYEVRVNGSYVSDDANYVIEARLTPPAEVAAQWAIDAVASSQYGEDGYSALQATGAPNVPSASDNPLAWASEFADGTVETLELTYANKVTPAGVRIYESYNPGAVTMVEAYDEEAEEWVVMWEGSEPTDEVYRVFSPELTPPDFVTDMIRLTIDSSSVSGWNEIDAVQLLGRP